MLNASLIVDSFSSAFFLRLAHERHQLSATQSLRTPIREPTEDNSLPVVTSWVGDEKWKIPKKLWDKDSCVYINPTILYDFGASPLQVVAIPKIVPLFLGSYTSSEAGGTQFFLLDVKPTSSYTRNYLATARHGLV